MIELPVNGVETIVVVYLWTLRSNGGELYRFSTYEDGHFGVKRTYDTIVLLCETTCM